MAEGSIFGGSGVSGGALAWREGLGMSDARLRSLERQWSESGSDADLAVLIAEALRVGALSRESVELAVYCGIPAAVLAQGGSAGPEDPSDWLVGLAQFGPQVCLRFMVQVGRRLLPVWLSEHPERDEPAQMLEILEGLSVGDREDLRREFCSRFDARNAYPYFMRDLGFNDPDSGLSEGARSAVGVVVGACNVYDDEEGLEDWLEELADLDGLSEDRRNLGLRSVAVGDR